MRLEREKEKNLGANKPLRAFGEMQPFGGMLEASLPGENRAEKNVVRRVNEEFAGSVCEFKGIGDNPRSYIR